MAANDLRDVVVRPRAISAPDPAQQGAFEQPQVITPEMEQALSQEFQTELSEKGFNTRQIAEVVGAWQIYARETRSWADAMTHLQRTEEVGDGFRARATQFLAACRRQNIRFRTPSVLNHRTLEDVLLKATKKHDKTTLKVAGGMFGLVVAVLLKAYLLLPVANSFLGKLLGVGQNLTKGIFSFGLACIIAYSITYLARQIMQLIVQMNAGEKIAQVRTVGDLLSSKANRILVISLCAIFSLVIYSLLRHDVTTDAGGGGFAAYGLNFLFVGIVIVYELAVAYRTAYFQINAKPELADELILAFNHSMERWHDEEDLGKLRTLILLKQQRWGAFLADLDAGAFEGGRAAARRARALDRMRGTKTSVVSVFGPRK